MEGIYHPASARLVAVCRDRPVAISLVDGILRAETFTPDGGFIGLVYAYTEDELAAKLDAGSAARLIRWTSSTAPPRA